MLCERGIRTFEHATRFTLDLAAVALLKRRTHLPVMVDPSHASGLPELVAPLTLAAVGAGVDALLIDVHVQPQHARCDGRQALEPAEFGELMNRIGAVALGLGRTLAVPASPGSSAKGVGWDRHRPGRAMEEVSTMNGSVPV